MAMKLPLHNLHISKEDPIADQCSLTDEGLLQISKNCDQLSSLHLSTLFEMLRCLQTQFGRSYHHDTSNTTPECAKYVYTTAN